MMPFRASSAIGPKWNKRTCTPEIVNVRLTCIKDHIYAMRNRFLNNEQPLKT